ncbi:hypothetical protein ACWDRX_38540, partial [Streptomyces nigra]
MSRQVLTVGPGERDRYRTIGEALAAARTGALISVRPGTYAENLVIDEVQPVTYVRLGVLDRPAGGEPPR